MTSAGVEAYIRRTEAWVPGRQMTAETWGGGGNTRANMQTDGQMVDLTSRAFLPRRGHKKLS